MRLLRRLVVLSCSVLALPCAAQQFVALRVSGCGTLNGSAQFPLTLAQPIPAGRHVIASVAYGNTGLTGVNVQDSNGTQYFPMGVAIVNNVIMANFIGRLTAPLNAGNFIRARADSGSGTSTCLHAAEYSGLVAVANPSQGLGTNSGNSNAQSVMLDMPATTAPLQLVGAVASITDPGTVTPTGGSTLIARTCRGAAPELCLASSRRVVSSVNVAHGMTSTSANSVAWTAVMGAFAGDPLFQNGFE
jgi:hypothetical protein